MPTLEFQAIVSSLQSAIFTPGNLVTVSAITTVANVPVLDLTVNQIDTDSFTLDETTTPPTLRITAHPEQSPWHSPIDAAGFYLYDLQYIQFADGSVQTTAFNAGAIGQSPWLQDVDAADFDLTNLASLEFSDGSVQSTAYLGVGSNQTPWLQQINAAGNNLINVAGVYGKLLDLKPTSDHAAYIYDVSGNLAWVFNSSGELSSQHRGISNLSFITFGDLTTQTTAYKGIVATQTPWITNIDAAGHSLSNVVTITANRVSLVQGTGTTEVQPGLVHIIPNGTNQPWVIYNAGGTVQDWVIGADGNLYTGSARGIRDVGHIRFADATVQTTAYIAGVGAQTPWTSNIDGGNFALSNVAGITATGITTSGGTNFLSNAEMVIVPKAGNNPFIVYNPGGLAVDWLISPAGHLSTNSGKQIFGVAGINFADATVQTTAFKGIPATQTPWLQDIDAVGHKLQNVSLLYVTPAAGSYPLTITNAANTQLDWYVDPSGNIASNTSRSILNINEVTAKRVVIKPLNSGDYPFAIATQADPNSYDWLVDPSGNLSSQTGRSITGVGQIDIQARNDGSYPFWVRRTDTQAAWYITDTGILGSNTNATIQGVGLVSAQMISAGYDIHVKANGVNWPFYVTNVAGDNQDWLVDLVGNFVSPTNKTLQAGNVATVGITASTVTTTGIVVLGGNLNWASAPGSGVLDTAIGRISAGKLQLYGPSGSEGDLYLRSITASAAISANGYITSGEYLATANAKTALWDVHHAMSFDADVRWSNDSTFYGVSDLMIMRATAGILRIWNPAAGELGELQCLTVVSPNVHQAARYDIYGGPIGVSGTYTTADGKTVTVTGGIITSIV